MFHITSGDMAGELLGKAGLPGSVFVWHDILYDGPRLPGWPDARALKERATFLDCFTDGGMGHEKILHTLRNQYRFLEEAENTTIILWFDACVFDQSMLVHILCCLKHLRRKNVELLCIDSFPGITPFNGLGQMAPSQLASVFNKRTPVTDEQFFYATKVDRAFAEQALDLLKEIADEEGAPIPWVAAATRRWIEEFPDPQTGFGRLEQLIMRSIENGCISPWDIFNRVAALDRPPQYWGDITLWEKINGLAARIPPVLKITGPTNRLPQWKSELQLKEFSIEKIT